MSGRRALRTLLGPLIIALAIAGSASAQQPAPRSAVVFNKSFTPNIVALGGSSTVTITFTNTNTTTDSTILSFKDDLATMGGHAAFAAAPNLATTCAGGTPSISGTVLTMNNGVIPHAPSPTTPGTCTITFNVVATAVGNGFNTIFAADFSNSLGTTGTQDVTQTLTVQAQNLTVSSGTTPYRTLVGATATQTLTIHNTTSVPLTNVSVPVTYNNAASFTITSVTTDCGATVTIPPQPSTTGTIAVSGGTIPAGGTCTISTTATSAVAATANFTIATGAVIDDQGVSNSTAGVSNQIIWAIGNPNVTKSFSPTSVSAGQTTTMTITVQNVFSDRSITGGAFTDNLPASLTVDTVTAPTFTNCTGTAAGEGTGALHITGLTIAAATTCTIRATIDVPSTQPAGGVTNTMLNTAFTSDQVNNFAQGSVSAGLTVYTGGGGGGFTATKAATPASAGVGVPITVTLTFTASGQTAGNQWVNGTFTDNLPQTPAAMAAVTTTAPTFTNCGGAPSVAFSSSNTVVTGSNLTIPTNGSCVVRFTITFTTPVPTPTVVTNSIPAPGVSFNLNSSGGTALTVGTNSVSLTEQPAYSVQNYTASASGLVHQPLTVTATLLNTAPVNDTNATITINLNASGANVALAPQPNFVFGANCPAGLSDSNITGGPGSTSFTVSIPAIFGYPCTITYNVIDVGGVSGTFTPGTSSYRSDLTGQTNVNSTGTNNVTWLSSTLNVTKSFSPTTIQAGSTSTASVAVGVRQAGTLASTQVNGVAYTDVLPADLVFATNPNVTFANCQQSGQPAPSYAINGTSIEFTNLSALTTGAAITNCVATFDVTSYTNGSRVNTIPASAITSTAQITNPAAAVATLTVGTGLGISKTFLTSQLHVGDDTYLRLLITNTTGIDPVVGQVTDNMPSQLSLASTAPGPTQPGDPPSCGGALSGTVGSSSYSIVGMSLPGNLAVPATTCVEYVLVQANTTATPGTYTNTIPVGGLTDDGFVNNTAASAPITIVSAPNVDVFKTFAPTTISPNGTSELTITIANDQTGAINLSNIALEDDLPTGVTLGYNPNPQTTCSGGSVAAVQFGTTVKLTGASLAAGASCTITAVVRASNVGSYVDTIPQGALTSLQFATNAALAQATLNVVQPPNVNVTKAFAPEQITEGTSSTATITIANTAPGAAALSHMGLTDTLPSGMTVFSTPNASTTCTGGTVTAVAGGTTVTLAGTSFIGAQLAAGASCTITFNVTGTTGTYTNTIAAGSVSTLQGATNDTAASAQLAVIAAYLNLSKAFSPSEIAPHEPSVLTVTIANTNTGAAALSALAGSDSLPSGVTLTATPGQSTTCSGATVVATPNAGSFSWSGGTLAAGASCTISVNVTSTAINNYTDTIPASTITTAQGVTNPTNVTADLDVVAPPDVNVTKAFSLQEILPGHFSTATITIANTAPGAKALSSVGLVDTLPSGLTVYSTPGASTTCPSATLTATAGASSVTLAGATVAAGASCTITFNVTGATIGTFTNTIPIGAVTTAQFATNDQAASAALAISTTAGVNLSKAFSPIEIFHGGTSVLTITLANTNASAVALSALGGSDTLPTGVTIATTPAASTTCGGTVTATSGGSTITWAGGTLGVGATCAITVTVTSTTLGSHVDSIPAGTIATAQGVTNPVVASANLNVVSPPGVVVSKAFAPEDIIAGTSSTATISIANTAPNAQPLSGLGLHDSLPAGLTVSGTPAASTTCTSGSVTATTGTATITLAGASLAAGASCTITFGVTGTTVNTFTNTIATGNVTTTQGASNAAPATAQLAISAVPALNLTKAFSPVQIGPGGTSTLTLTIANTNLRAIALTGLGGSDSLPSGITIATTPAASTTCAGATLTAPAGGATISFAGATLAAGASCTVTVNVTGTTLGTFANTIPANALVTTQGASNAVAVTATLAITTPSLSVAKSSSPQGAQVTRGQTIVYTIAITNNGSGIETNAFVHDVLSNATLVSGSVQVNGASAPDTVITSAQPFGNIAPGATTTITYSATVNQSAPARAQVTNTATAGGTQPCTGSQCTASSTPNTVASPSLTISKQINDQQQINAIPGQTVTYTILVSNTALGEAQHVVVTDPLPTGMTPVAGSVTLNGAPAPGATITGQTVTVPIGTLASGASATITVKATVGTNVATGSLSNVATVSSSDLTEASKSNEAVAQLHPSTLVVTKTASATVATVGDRVNYAITVQPLNSVAYGITTVVDTLPDFQIYAPGTARANGTSLEPKVAGHVLTWTLPSLGTSARITYSVAISAGAQPNASLTNTAAVRAEGPGGSIGTGEASASVLVVASNLGSCYPITGRVYLDEAGTGHFQGSDPGLSGVRVYLDSGEYVITDQHGLYNFPCVRPGMHALRLDATTLPAGATPYNDHNIDSEKSTRRLVHGIFDTTIIKDINFAIKPGPKQP